LSEAESPERRDREVTVDDVRALMGPSTPHFALQLRNRIAKLIRGLPADHPARIEGEREIARLDTLGFSGETRGMDAQDGQRPLPSLAGEGVVREPAGHD
jgi:hypothetical protein